MRKLETRPLLLFALLLGATAARSQEPLGSWRIEPMPEARDHGLASVSASSATDAWAVWKGIYHWDGATWSLVPAPGLGDPNTVFNQVAAIAPGDAWIVGFTSFLGTPQTLAEHWDGSRWSVVPSPVVAGGSFFDAVGAAGPDDVWAVGSRMGGHPVYDATRVTLTAHWDGSRWTEVPSPNRSNRSHELLDVAALATDDVWAVGNSRDLGGDFRTLILHWDGSSWSIVPSPNLPGENILYGVSAFAPDDAWAVGDAWDGVTARQLFLHWDGASWSQVEGPGGATACTGCTADVLALGPADVWAVGSRLGHWDGAAWSLDADVQVPGAAGKLLRSIARVGEGDAWAVGGSFDLEGVEDALSLYLTRGGAPPPPLESGGPGGRGPLSLRVGPNPSRGECAIALTLPAAQHVRVAVLDAGGRLVRELAAREFGAGTTSLRWDGHDARGVPAAAGAYFIMATAGERRVVERVLLTR